MEGFNVGVNEGEVAGQTVAHCPLHLIPRRRGDVEEPEGASVYSSHGDASGRLGGVSEGSEELK